MDVLDDPGHHGLELLARHVGLELRLRRAGRGVSSGGSGPASRVRTCADRLDRPRVGGVDAGLVVEVGVGQDRDRVAQVVEGDDHVGEHQRHVRQPEHVRVGLGQALDGAHAVEAEEADGAAGERRQAGDLGLADGSDTASLRRACTGRPRRRRLQRTTRFGRQPMNDQRPTLLALLGGLEQERRAVAAQLQERGDGRLAVLDERVA